MSCERWWRISGAGTCVEDGVKQWCGQDDLVVVEEFGEERNGQFFQEA